MLHEIDEILGVTSDQESALDGGVTSGSRMMDQSLSALMKEYYEQVEEIRKQQQLYLVQMRGMRQNLEKVTRENERLHAELKEAIEKQLDAFPFDSLGTNVIADEYTVKNLQEQLELETQAKERAVELWQTLVQEHDLLQQKYQEHLTETEIHMVEMQKHKDQLTGFQRLTQQLRVANEKKEFTNQQLLQIVAQQNVELQDQQKQLRQARKDEQAANVKVDEMTRSTERLQSQLERKEEKMLFDQQREAAYGRHLYQMQTRIKQLEARLSIAVQDDQRQRKERAAWEKQTVELQKEIANLVRAKQDAAAKIQDYIHLLEEANLQKSWALSREKKKEEEIKKMKYEMSQFAEDNAARIRKAVDMAKKQYKVQISRLEEELSALQLECGEKQGQIERAIREKRAVEAELEKIYQVDEGYESDNRKLEQLHQKYLLAETTKGDLQLTLQTTQNKLKQLEINFEEEKSRSQEVICHLQNTLKSERKKSVSISEQSLKLQQENEQLQKEVEELRKQVAEAEQKANIKISTMEHERDVKEHGYEAQLKEMEDSNLKSTAELTCLLLAQQKATNQWKEEAKKITETTEARISKLKRELSQQKICNQELISQLEVANEKAAEDEKLMREYQQYINRLQRRLNQAEERAITAQPHNNTEETSCSPEGGGRYVNTCIVSSHHVGGKKIDGETSY
ncbi:sodium channel and clathrin linker 1 isoform X1 [Melopsittacus undulatus]|uniref:sodium channel and clathrin linker 1 isoform X1 n=1 Tax=Melopsittacus undulatus TaxID=13146 RepID=UPI00146E5B8A|nr:sodium channel and clathrin linker 1 isoform X1 [Melopsittacus undulatus]XP_030899245.2 sodium channel and clathrin linker 1 isoform X1 [Melopsittacus undulatus]XP_030899246.2 sodium channel and clathrin linker 1 isoform X1 [Melopsittacus undulatus]XP_030899247.2 sodium channel and clathrin linker 1 isoform X1 [Melopsittacus undulatus]